MLSRDEYESVLYLDRKASLCTNAPRLRIREDNLAANMTHEQIAGLERAG